jgi:hypothetical protein
MTPLQFAAKYLPEDDRILLRIGHADKEVQVWLTRRLVKLLWPVLGQIAVKLVDKRATAPAVRREISDLQRQVALQQADFSTPYRQEREAIQDASPLLATHLVVKSLPDGTTSLRLQDARSTGVDLPMDTAVHSGFCELIRKCAAESGWDITLEYDSRTQPTATGGLH